MAISNTCTPEGCAPGNFPLGGKRGWAAADGIKCLKQAQLHEDFVWPDLVNYKKYETHKYLPVALDRDTGHLLSPVSLDGATPHYATAAAFAADFYGWLDHGRYQNSLVNGQAVELCPGMKAMVITDVCGMHYELNTPGAAVRVNDLLGLAINADTGLLNPYKYNVVTAVASAIAVVNFCPSDQCFVKGGNVSCCHKLNTAP